MAERTIVTDPNVGLVGPPKIVTDEEGRIPAELAVQIQQYLEEIRANVNNINFGSGNQSTKAGHASGQWIEFVAPSVADTQFKVPHGLGATPTGYSVMRRDRSSMLYDSNVGGWGPKAVYFKSSVGLTLFKIILWG